MVQVEIENIADRVAILGAIQTVDGRRPGIGMRQGVAIELGFKPRGQRRVSGGVGPGHTGGRHLARAQLVQDLLERLRMRRYIAADIRQSHAAGLQPVVVAAYAVARRGAFEQ